MPNAVPADVSAHLRLLIMTQGSWGERIADNIRQHCPEHWEAHTFAAPRFLPPIVDDPDEYLPDELPRADLLLALGDTPGAAQLIPDIVQRSGAKSVIAPIDNNASLPPGLVRQLRGWLQSLSVVVVFPKPFCSLTEATYNLPPIRASYADPLISQFARFFGMPQFDVPVDAERQIAAVQVLRNSACGCARAVAVGLAGCSIDKAEFEAGMLHHHFPCQAGMNQDGDYGDTLMHVSGHILRDAVKDKLRPYLEPTPYFRPMGRVEDEESLG